MSKPQEATLGAIATVSSRIRATLGNMTKSQRVIGDLLLREPDLAVRLSIYDLASKAGTSASTVTRFCQLLGYDGYQALRIASAGDLGWVDAQRAWSADEIQSLSPSDSPDKLLEHLLAVQVSALRAAAKLLDLGKVADLARRIAAASRVDVYGIGASGYIADTITGHLYHGGINVASWTEVHQGVAAAAWLNSDSVAMGVSLSGSTYETICMLSEAAARGAFTVAVTSDITSPLAGIADLSLITFRPVEHWNMEGVTAQMTQLFVLDLLCLMVVNLNGKDAADRLARARVAVARYKSSLPVWPNSREPSHREAPK
ncbi:MAG: MurR/RpiR family transcriptional regulator [Bifidobacteriaceae bacterium]|jgi:DNA-binding MurR/RpiR family transcriptional regulator|nr:MurR/RpiR family transcriptional regulator [Bifidobacteriaceae bacterium]